MAHTPNGPAVFYRGQETIYVEDGVQPDGWSDRPEDEADEAEKPRRGRKPKAEDVSVATEDVDEVSDVTEAEAEDGADNVQ